jgi:hypothetical protein
LYSAIVTVNYSAYILNTGGEIVSTVNMSLDSANYRLGLMMVLGASMLSGLSAALTQKALVGSKPRHPLFFSAELAVYGIIFLVVRALFSAESESILAGNLFAGWNPYTFIPVTTNVRRDDQMMCISQALTNTQLFEN